jgi:hypothetical protein
MIYEIPIVGAFERAAVLSRRDVREPLEFPMPRDARPSRARRERLPLALRELGARSRRIAEAAPVAG